MQTPTADCSLRHSREHSPRYVLGVASSAGIGCGSTAPGSSLSEPSLFAKCGFDPTITVHRIPALDYTSEFKTNSKPPPPADAKSSSGGSGGGGGYESVVTFTTDDGSMVSGLEFMSAAGELIASSDDSLMLFGVAHNKRIAKSAAWTGAWSFLSAAQPARIECMRLDRASGLVLVGTDTGVITLSDPRLMGEGSTGTGSGVVATCRLSSRSVLASRESEDVVMSLGVSPPPQAGGGAVPPIFAAGTMAGATVMFDLRSLMPINSFVLRSTAKQSIYPSISQSLDFSATGRLLFAGTDGEGVRAWDTLTGCIAYRFPPNDGVMRVVSVRTRPDGGAVLVQSHYGGYSAIWR